MATLDFSIAPESVGSFNYLNRKYLIWASTRNAGQSSAQQWQFRYSPLLVPEVTELGELCFSQKNPTATSARVFLPIHLYSEAADRLAYEAVQRLYPNHATQIIPGNVIVLQVRTIRFALDDLTNCVPSAKLTENIDLFSLVPTIVLTVDVSDENAAAAVKKYLSASTIKYAIGFDAKTTRQNAVTVRYKDIKSSTLFAQLDGKGTNEVYVHRDDLRRLSEGLSRTIEAVGVIEDPARFDQDIFAKILTNLTQGTSSASFDEQKWKSTYYGDDLKPDVITRTLNKMFSKNDDEQRWKYHADAEFSSKAELVGILGGEAKAKGSYDDEGLRHTLAERGIEAQFEGNRIVAKSIELRQVNTSQFSVDGVFTSLVTYVEDSGLAQNGSINLAATSPSQWIPDIPGRVAALEAAAQRPIEVLEVRKSDRQFGAWNANLVYGAAELTLAPGTWHVFGAASVFVAGNPDEYALGLYNATKDLDVPDSTGPVVVGMLEQPSALTTSRVMEITEPTRVRLKAFRHGNSVVAFGNNAPGLQSLKPQRLYAVRLK